jgi:hypothetical protein
MYILCPSRGPGLVGNQCQGTGGKIGRATTISMDKVFPLRSPPVMVELWSPTMRLLLAGPLGRPSPAPSFVRDHPCLGGHRPLTILKFAAC